MTWTAYRLTPSAAITVRKSCGVWITVWWYIIKTETSPANQSAVPCHPGKFRAMDIVTGRGTYGPVKAPAVIVGIPFPAIAIRVPRPHLPRLEMSPMRVHLHPVIVAWLCPVREHRTVHSYRCCGFGTDWVGIPGLFYVGN